jgi:hypothetical protein
VPFWSVKPGQSCGSRTARVSSRPTGNFNTMADQVARIRDVAFAGAGRMAQSAEAVVNNSISQLHVHAAPGMDARQLVDAIEAEWRRRGRGALYDRPGAI